LQFRRCLEPKALINRDQSIAFYDSGNRKFLLGFTKKSVIYPTLIKSPVFHDAGCIM